MLENILTVLIELKNAELLVDRKSKIGPDVRYNMVYLMEYYIIWILWKLSS